MLQTKSYQPERQEVGQHVDSLGHGIASNSMIHNADLAKPLNSQYP